MKKTFKKKHIFLFCFILFFSFARAEENFTDSTIDYYDSITMTSEFKSNFFYIPVSLKPNNLIDDIKVSMVEAIPFAFLYTFAYIFFSEAISQNTLQPKLKTLEEYKETYIKTAIVFSIINTSVNFITYYNRNEKGVKK